MCSTRLMRRFPALDSRWRCWSPEEAPVGAVPFQEAKWPRSAKRAMSPMSPSSRAALDGPMPLRSCRLLPVPATSSVSCAFAALIFLAGGGELADQLTGQPASGPPGDIAWPDRREQGAGLLGGQELLRAPGQ